MAEQQIKPARPPKGRSPSYPGIPLSTAVQRARVLKENAGRHQVPMANITGYWGYKTPYTGPASVTYAALKKYGLLDEEGSGDARMGKLSDLGWDILMNPDPMPSIQKAALLPAIHREIWELYGDDLPPEDAMRFEFVGKRGFTDSGFTDFLRVYRETIAFAQLSSAGNLPEEPDPPKKAGAHESRREQQRRGGGVSQDGILTIPVPVIGGAPIVIEGEFPVSEAAWSQFIAVLQAMKPGLVAEPKPSQDEGAP